MGVHRTCGELNETELTIRVPTGFRNRIDRRSSVLVRLRLQEHGVFQVIVIAIQTHLHAFTSVRAPEPFNSTPMAANSIPFGSPHVRPMGVHRT